MVRFLSRMLFVGVTVITLMVGSSVAATVASRNPGQPAASVGGQQHFFGTVNGNHTGAVVYVFCPGPIGGDRTGPPMAGQPLGLLLIGGGAGGGYTGSAATAFVVTLLDDPSARVRLGEYGITKAIPTSLALPCQGTGTVRFRSVPMSQGSVPDDVEVTYQNLGV